ncbi:MULTISPECIES: hypothetical protein [unclassified Sphingomonas]|uniref:hypothetical protein n=1 Tax=unclassified Sphingomonas TaxID=196159 RepID=UPI001F599244|nr:MULTISPECIES: hypothetical protein [unclassified Sphingomonas]
MMKTLLATLLLCAPITAQATEPQSSDKTAEGDKKICRSEEVTGSLFPKRVCRSKAEWATISAQRQVLTDRLRDQKYVGAADVAR